MSEAVTELRIALTVDDFDEAVAFYRDALGMKVLEMWNAPGANGVLLEAGHATLELFDEGQAAAVDDILTECNSRCSVAVGSTEATQERRCGASDRSRARPRGHAGSPARRAFQQRRLVAPAAAGPRSGGRPPAA